jgi:hypothetical protein
MDALAADQSEFGLGLTTHQALEVGVCVHVDGYLEHDHVRRGIQSDAQVRWCVALGNGRYRIGLLIQERDSGPHQAPPPASSDPENDYYELLQLSPKADTETINRVFRMLAARYHPDNSDTGNTELFRRVVEAHRILSDPERRAAYDAVHRAHQQVRWKIFDGANVTMGAAAEKRKRSGILSVLYAKRMQQPDQPAVSLRELEDLLGCPKEHLEFSIWYLRERGQIQRADNGKVQITANGIDAAEQTPGTVFSDASHLLTAPSA